MFVLKFRYQTNNQIPAYSSDICWQCGVVLGVQLLWCFFSGPFIEDQGEKMNLNELHQSNLHLQWMELQWETGAHRFMWLLRAIVGVLGIMFSSSVYTKFRLIRRRTDNCNSTSVRNKPTSQVCCFPAFCPLAAKCQCLSSKPTEATQWRLSHGPLNGSRSYSRMKPKPVYKLKKRKKKLGHSFCVEGADEVSLGNMQCTTAASSGCRTTKSNHVNIKMSSCETLFWESEMRKKIDIVGVLVRTIWGSWGKNKLLLHLSWGINVQWSVTGKKKKKRQACSYSPRSIC